MYVNQNSCEKLEFFAFSQTASSSANTLAQAPLQEIKSSFALYQSNETEPFILKPILSVDAKAIEKIKKIQEFKLGLERKMEENALDKMFEPTPEIKVEVPSPCYSSFEPSQNSFGGAVPVQNAGASHLKTKVKLRHSFSWLRFLIGIALAAGGFAYRYRYAGAHPAIPTACIVAGVALAAFEGYKGLRHLIQENSH